MPILTPRTKESIKTALAMTIAYDIALSMDWDRPYWAGFAVAFISISTIGQSLSYSFLSVADTAAMFVLIFGVLAVANQPALALVDVITKARPSF